MKKILKIITLGLLLVMNGCTNSFVDLKLEKNLYKYFACENYKFGMKNLINSKNQKITVWTKKYAENYSLPISVVTKRSNDNFVIISKFYDNPFKYRKNDISYNLITKYILFDINGDGRNLKLNSSLYELDEKTVTTLFDIKKYLDQEYDSKKYTDGLVKKFLVIEKAIFQKKPIIEKFFQRTCVLQ